ncbi:hypothetical protein [Teredinibacter sp. KSP-S5-2]|uniref:hypothetical protein n=1 Tax=Teredinibacter sp. KSP-S5-2 TaxID=3034506 RepID=UPI002934CB4A|nr:hypothetical protein [Teredinibacter sp. KSP-S5-2]WNO10504.1 hypothetical protein P5V12_04895 [Teredinibacter sp. KSP-S5-2]
MLYRSSSLKIGLLDNGAHSLKRGFEMWFQWKDSGDAWLLKESVIWVHHGIELLLKQLLVQTNEFLVFQDVNKAVERLGILRKKPGMEDAGVLDLFENDDKVMSVGFRNLIERTAITLPIDELSDGAFLRRKIDQLTRYRNKIVHFSVELNVVEISSLLSDTLNPLLSLLAENVKDQKFVLKAIPEIRRLVQPIDSYLDSMRREMVGSAIEATKEAISPEGNGKAGAVIQAVGTGLNTTLVMYMETILKLDFLEGNPIILLVDRRIYIDQLLSHILFHKESGLSVAVAETVEHFSQILLENLHDVILWTVQSFEPDILKRAKSYLIVLYKLCAVPNKLFSIPSNCTYILFSNTFKKLPHEMHGGVIANYDLRQAISDDVLKPFSVVVRKLWPIVNRDFNQFGLKDRISGRGKNLSDIGFAYLRACAEFIVENFESRRENLGGKAVVIVRDVVSAKCLEKCIFDIRPNWKSDEISERIASAISSANPQDKIRFLDIFKEKDDPASLMIGTGEIFTGYDNSFIYTVYITCDISNKLQNVLAGMVSRCNLVDNNGLIVDLFGVQWMTVG